MKALPAVGADGTSEPYLHTQQRVPRWPTVLEVNPFGALVGIMISTAAVRRVGGLHVHGILGCADWDLWVRLIRTRAVVTTVPATLGRYRRHPASMSRRSILMLDSKIDMLDRCVRQDERLAGLPAGRPIDRAQYARFRNGYVFHEIGAGAAAAPTADVSSILSRLAPGAIDPFYCAQNFVWGWYHANGPRAAVPERAIITTALDACDGALGALGWAGAAAAIGESADRIIRHRHDARWLFGAVRRRLRRWATEVAARPRRAA